jgi:flagellar protein FlaG
MIHPLTPKADLLPTPGRRKESGEEAKHLPTAAGADSGPTKTTDAQPHQETVNRVVARIREVFQKSDQRLEIEVDPDLHRVIVKIINQDTNEVIRQIPIKEALELEKRLSDEKGLLIEEHV